MSTEVIQLKQVTVRRGNEHSVLSGFDLSVGKGEMVILLGESGSGKSTIFKLLTGELRPDSGEVIVGGTSIPRLSRGALAEYRRSIGVVFQDVKLLDDRSVRDQIALPLEIEWMKKQRREERLKSILERFDLTGVAEKYPVSLSMSERSRVSIARAVASEPLVLLADDPSSHLDRASTRAIAEILRQEHSRGMTVLIGTSDEYFVSYLPEARLQALSVAEEPA